MTIRSLLPPNSTTLERALEGATARIGDVPAPVKELWNPDTCPLELLPWLAWALSADRWESDWSEEEKRDAVRRAIELQRKKGTPASIEAVLAGFDELLTLTEWFEARPIGAPHTFTVDLPLVQLDGTTGGERATAAFVDSVVRDIIRTKPVRSHFKLRQMLEAAGTLRVVGAARGGIFLRLDMAADETSAAIWDSVLLTETGEPLQAADGSYFEVSHSIVPPPLAFYGLALDFAAGEYWKDGAQAASLQAFPGYSFSRAGAVGAFRAGAVTMFGANVPAVNGSGILVSQSATNWLQFSRDLTNAAWNKRGASVVTTDGTAGADGTGLASKVTVGGFNDDVFQGLSTGGHFREFLIKKVTAAGVLSIVSPYDGTEQFNVDLSLVGTGWERIAPGHPAIIFTSAGAPTHGGMHFYSLHGETLTFYVDFCQALDVDVRGAGAIIPTTSSFASIGADNLTVDDAAADGDQLFIIRGSTNAANNSNARLGSWIGGDFSGNDSIDIMTPPDGSGGHVLNCTILAGGAVVHVGQAPVSPNAQLTAIVRRLAGRWRVGFIENGGALTWTAEGPPVAFPALAKAMPGRYGPSPQCQPDVPIAFMGRKAGTFATDEQVLAVVAEIS